MENFFEGLSAIVIAFILGEFVGKILKKCLPESKPEGVDEAIWKAVMTPINGGGNAIGRFERPLMLLSFWVGEYEIIGGWLLFKVAAKWDAWANIIQIPASIDSFNPIAWYQVRRYFGSWILSRFLVGTLINVLIAALAAYLGCHLFEIIAWVSNIECGK